MMNNSVALTKIKNIEASTPYAHIQKKKTTNVFFNLDDEWKSCSALFGYI